MTEKGFAYCIHCGNRLTGRLTGRFSSATGEPTKNGICLNPLCEVGKVNSCQAIGHQWNFGILNVKNAGQLNIMKIFKWIKQYILCPKRAKITENDIILWVLLHSDKEWEDVKKRADMAKYRL